MQLFSEWIFCFVFFFLSLTYDVCSLMMQQCTAKSNGKMFDRVIAVVHYFMVLPMLELQLWLR